MAGAPEIVHGAILYVWLCPRCGREKLQPVDHGWPPGVDHPGEPDPAIPPPEVTCDDCRRRFATEPLHP
jgi:hypothetical protein